MPTERKQNAGRTEKRIKVQRKKGRMQEETAQEESKECNSCVV
jgi:hypothetical protein